MHDNAACSMPRVAVLDVGISCALGRTWPAVLRALVAAQSGLAYEAIHGYPTAVGRVHGDIPSTFDGGLELDRGVALALDCVGQLEFIPQLNPHRCAVFWGVGIAGAHWLENSYEQYCSDRGDAKTSPWTVPMIMPNAAASLIAKRLKLTGGAWTHASACASSAMAIGQAFHAIRSGSIDLAVVGGSDAMLTPGMLHAWARMRVLARTDQEGAEAACRPFDVHRNGLCLAEGAACLLLLHSDLAESMDLKAMAHLHGFGHSCDAFDLTAPSEAGQELAIRLALSDAHIQPQEVSYVCAHATGTRKGDVTELLALQAAWSGHIGECPVSSLKSAMGHTMGAAGAVASAMTVAMLASDWVAPTLHLGTIDPLCTGWALPAKHGIHHDQMKYALVNAFGFGGSNACLIFKK
jgi:3-oxoacyl-(acyl-carrier-protein) synthase